MRLKTGKKGLNKFFAHNRSKSFLDLAVTQHKLLSNLLQKIVEPIEQFNQ